MALGGISQDQAATIAARGKVLRPRMLVEIGGIDPCDLLIPPPPTLEALYPKQVVVQRQNIFGADRFKAVFALGLGQDYDFWAPLRAVSFNLKLRYEGNTDGAGQWIQVFRGVADNLDIDCNRGEAILTGRTLSAVLIDAQIKSGNFNNTPKADVIRNLVEQYGLTVDFGHSDPDGDMGNQVHEERGHQAFGAQTTDIKEWDVISRIAQETGRTAYAKDEVIHVHNELESDIYYIQAPSRTYDASGKICTLGPTNSTTLRFSHNYTLIKYNLVIGANHNPHTATVNLYKWPENACAAAEKNPSVINMVAKNEEDAKQKVMAYANQRQGFEWSVEWTTTGPEILHVDVVDTLQVVGTNSLFDGPYQIYSIEHNISFERGLTTTIIGKSGDFIEPGNI
jgi:hypothetical protein